MHLGIWGAFLLIWFLLRKGAFGKPVILVIMISWMLASSTLMTVLERVLVEKPGIGFCPQCGYNLTGLTSQRCPECGCPVKGLE